MENGMDNTEKLLKDLTDASGVPGYETEVRRVIRSYLKPHGEITQDKMGSLICKKDGKRHDPRLCWRGIYTVTAQSLKEMTSTIQ
jgi:endoglucanase